MISKYYLYKFAGIYSIKNITNGKRYIGSSKNIHRRMLCHRYELEHNCHHSNYFQKSFNKHGIENFQIEILEKIDLNIYSEDYLYERESYYVDFYNSSSSNFGYNMTKGGKGSSGIPMSDKIKRALKAGRKPVTEITRKRISEAGKGRHHTVETKAKMSKSRKGVPQPWNPRGLRKNLSDEVRIKIGDATRGISKSDSQKEKMSKSNAGIKKLPRSKKTASQYVGVSFMKNRNKWVSYININRKRTHLGLFDNEIDAAIAYNESAIVEYGNNTRLNIINKGENKND